MGNKINLINGNFITLDNSCSNAETISIQNGKISGINALDYNYKNFPPLNSPPQIKLGGFFYSLVAAAAAGNSPEPPQAL